MSSLTKSALYRKWKAAKKKLEEQDRHYAEQAEKAGKNLTPTQKAAIAGAVTTLTPKVPRLPSL